MYKNHEGYADPTAGTAIGNVTREERRAARRERREMKHRKKVYIVSPYAGDVERNVEKAIGYCCYAIRQKCIPVASHLLYPAMLCDAVKEQREMGIQFGLALLAVCNEVWVFGDRRTQGMQMEIEEAMRLGKPISYFGEDTGNV